MSPAPTDNLAEAAAHLAAGRLDRAAAAYAEALDEDPADPVPALALARLALSLEQLETTELLVDWVLGLDAGNTEALLLAGLAAEGRDDLSAALQRFRQAAATAPAAYETRYHLGRALVVAGLVQEGIAELDQAIELAAVPTGALYALAIARHQNGDLPGAIEALGRLVDADPTYLDGYVTLADLLCEAGKLDAAETALTQAAALFPDAGPVHDKIAAVRLKKGDLRGVLRALQDRIRVEPAAEEAYVALYAAALDAGDAQAAASAVDQLISRRPLSWQGYYLRSTLLDAAGQPDRAIDSLREAHRLAPSEWKPLNDLGTLLNARAQTQPDAAPEAVAVLEKAAALAPGSELGPRYNLGLALWNAGRRPEARATVAGLLQSAPDAHPVTQQAREVLAAMDQVLGSAP